MLSVSISKFSNADESWSNASKNEKTIKKISPSASEAKRVSSRAHSFPWPAEFRGIWVFAAEFEPRNFPRNSSFCRGISHFSFEQLFFTENDLKVALLQVCL